MCNNWKESIFSDGTSLFVNKKEPKLGDLMEVSLRFWKNSPVEKVWVNLVLNGAARCAEDRS